MGIELIEYIRAWPDPRHTSSFEFCENGAKAVSWEATSRRATPAFFSGHTLAELWTWNDHDLENAGRLTHPSIVIIHDVGEGEDGTAYIAMELLQGESLKAALARPARRPFEELAELAAQIADGLDYAQRHEVVHRDVKPANIMVTAPGAAKLTDFGIAYVPSASGASTEMLGSPRYMSPEQVKGEALDGRSDIFSLGVVLYEMLTRRTPFERASDASVFPLMQRIVAAPHQRPSEVDPSIPRGFDVLLARALAKDVDRRYQRGAEFAADLRRLGALPGADRPEQRDRRNH